jgi:glycosyltransferase involved in cell wall biosynthesis
MCNYMCESSITRNMNQPLLHVMIPAYGESPLLDATLSSACANLPESIPITVVEDPSEHSNIVKISSNYTGRVNYVRNTNRIGIGANFNRCIELSKGKYTQICGHDDLFIENPLPLISKLDNKYVGENHFIFRANVLQESDLKRLKIGDFTKFLLTPKGKKNKTLNSYEFLRSLMVGCWPYFPAIIWRTGAIRRIKFDTEFNSAMDFKLLIDLSIRNENFIYVPQQFLSYRRHEQSASSLNLIGLKRFDEEMFCHKYVFDHAKQKKLSVLKFVSSLALSVRGSAIIHVTFSKQNSILKFKNILLILRTSVANYKSSLKSSKI